MTEKTKNRENKPFHPSNPKSEREREREREYPHAIYIYVFYVPTPFLGRTKSVTFSNSISIIGTFT